MGRKQDGSEERAAGIARAAAGVAATGLLAAAWHFGRDRLADALETWADACEDGPETYPQAEPETTGGDSGELRRLREENERMAVRLEDMGARLRAYESQASERDSGDERLRAELRRVKNKLRATEDAAKEESRERMAHMTALRKENDALRAKLEQGAKPKPRARRKTRAQLAEESGERAAKAIASGDTPHGRYRAALGTSGSVGWRVPGGWACITPIPVPGGRYEGWTYATDGAPMGALGGATSFALEDVPAERVTLAELRELEGKAREWHERAAA